ncbi:MAG: response regulator [candidate division WOR-3 bacterium]
MQKKMKVLIIDDNRDLANSLKDALNNYSSDYECLAFYDGNSAMNYITNNPPDVIFTDIILPDQSGLSILKSVKEMDSDIQVIVMTAYASLSTSIEALQYGAFDYIPKPLHINQVMNALKSAINKRNSLLENKKIIADLINKKEKNLESDESRKVIERLILLKQFQKKISKINDIQELFKISYLEFSKIFLTQFVYFFLKESKGFKNICGPSVGEFKIGDIVDPKLPIFFVPVKNNIGCIFAGSKSMTSVMSYENDIIGVVYFKRENDFVDTDLEIAEVLSFVLANKFSEIKLNKKLKTTKYGLIYTLLTLTGLSDSNQKTMIERRAKYCEDFAKFLKFDEEKVEKIKFSSMLFNIIQSFVKDKKNGSKEVSEKFKSVIDDIEFLRELEPIIESIGENYDGSGFPKRLKGDDIPVESQVIKLVHTYLLMVENKNYRDGVGKRNAFENLEKMSEKYFKKSLVEKFITFLEQYERTNS